MSETALNGGNCYFSVPASAPVATPCDTTAVSARHTLHPNIRYYFTVLCHTEKLYCRCIPTPLQDAYFLSNHYVSFGEKSHGERGICVRTKCSQRLCTDRLRDGAVSNRSGCLCRRRAPCPCPVLMLFLVFPFLTTRPQLSIIFHAISGSSKSVRLRFLL